ncbi:unnamed protein product, partial [marine sediment metagenome]
EKGSRTVCQDNLATDGHRNILQPKNLKRLVKL